MPLKEAPFLGQLDKFYREVSLQDSHNSFVIVYLKEKETQGKVYCCFQLCGGGGVPTNELE